MLPPVCGGHTDARPAGEHKPVVLVVDDEALVRNLVTTILQRKGYVVLAAVDGLDGLVLSRSYPGNIDLVITDLNMPKLNGVELLKKLLEERPGIRSIVMSGSEKDIVIRDHVLPFLSKPFDVEVLLSKIRKTGCCEEAVCLVGSCPCITKWQPCSRMPQESQIESCKDQDDSYVHYQPFPEPVPEEQEICSDYDGYHQHYVKRDNDVSFHSQPPAQI